ncbi:uncharacterized protein [Ptychodera flava]|uniref:uncharacterized protein n=1 Tax=Ptychodera flava TaxID=63121 RepID=UPI00396A8B10
MEACRRYDAECRRKRKNLDGCNRLLKTFLTKVHTDSQNLSPTQRKRLDEHTVELLKSLEAVLTQTGSNVSESPRLSRLVNIGGYEEKLQTFDRTPRPPLEMGQLLEKDMLTWLREMYVDMRLPDNVENPLSARTMCYCFQSHLSDAKFYGACVGSFVGAENLKKYFIEGLENTWFKDRIVSALESARNGKLNSPVPFDSRVECSAFQFGNKNVVFNDKHNIGQCYRCKKLFRNVKFNPDRQPGREDEGFPWGNCAEYYALSKL